MKTCQKCNELNGENRTTCWKCGAALLHSQEYKKICPKCRYVFSSKVDYCDHCGSHLNVYSQENNSSSDYNGCFLYIVAVLFPLIGLIISIVYFNKNEYEFAKSLLITSVATIIIQNIFIFMLRGCFSYI